jgi:redox-sensitive bicupin YhaK (pirin superfamily)
MQDTHILHRDDLPLGGFAGLREHRVVVDPRAFGPQPTGGAWPGIGNLVYLADARFVPHGETRLHPHRDIDVISVVVEGRIAHEGSLGDGHPLSAPDVQVQRAGGEGFTHNEINPDPAQNRMIQLWILPEAPDEPASYHVYRPALGAQTRVYGGPASQSDTLPAKTVLDIAQPRAGDTVSVEGAYLAYLTKGGGVLADGRAVVDGDLIRGENLRFEARHDTQLVLGTEVTT